MDRAHLAARNTRGAWIYRDDSEGDLTESCLMISTTLYGVAGADCRNVYYVVLYRTHFPRMFVWTLGCEAARAKRHAAPSCTDCSE